MYSSSGASASCTTAGAVDVGMDSETGAGAALVVGLKKISSVSRTRAIKQQKKRM